LAITTTPLVEILKKKNGSSNERKPTLPYVFSKETYTKETHRNSKETYGNFQKRARSSSEREPTLHYVFSKETYTKETYTSVNEPSICTQNSSTLALERGCYSRCATYMSKETYIYVKRDLLQILLGQR